MQNNYVIAVYELGIGAVPYSCTQLNWS